MLAGLTAFKLGLLYLQWSGSSKNFWISMLYGFPCLGT
jgi:hypothetical protein